MSSRRPWPWVVVFALVATASTALVSACAPSPDSKAVTEILQPDYAAYAQYVDPYIQNRCGTLDCHGQPGRAYRIYGVSGLRPFNVSNLTDAGVTSGGGTGGDAVTEYEKRANYESAIALEPEEMSRVVARQGQDPNTLLLLRKPLNFEDIERHKGGKAMTNEADPGYPCLVGWLSIPVTRRRADGDFEQIPEGQRAKLSPAAIAACAAATAASNP